MRVAFRLIKDTLSYLSYDLEEMRFILEIHKTKFIMLSLDTIILSIIPSVFIVFAMAHFTFLSYFIVLITIFSLIPFLIIPMFSLVYYGQASRLSLIYSTTLIILIIASYIFWISYFFNHNLFH